MEPPSCNDGKASLLFQQTARPCHQPEILAESETIVQTVSLQG